ncbi:hypothetical protein LIER_08688 [Lithospermum erythrorhizon]|uniref:Uncharacterized protein n=1 Tax=Lithospermum erythrorhizon TaxID=34254 RepID=A0AAV3PHA3_LITER
MSACSKITYIVRLRQMLRRWRNKAAMTAGRTPSDVPAGHVAVTVGSNSKRFIIRASYLNHPLFKKLLIHAEEEFGFAYSGPLAIPCDEFVFEQIIKYMARYDSAGKNNSARFVNIEDFQRYCHVSFRSNIEFWAESRPLLNGVSDKAIW